MHTASAPDCRIMGLMAYSLDIWNPSFVVITVRSSLSPPGADPSSPRVSSLHSTTKQRTSTPAAVRLCCRLTFSCYDDRIHETCTVGIQTHEIRSSYFSVWGSQFDDWGAAGMYPEHCEAHFQSFDGVWGTMIVVVVFGYILIEFMNLLTGRMAPSVVAARRVYVEIGARLPFTDSMVVDVAVLPRESSYNFRCVGRGSAGP